MTGFLPEARDRFALNTDINELTPGRRIRVAGTETAVLGLIRCVDAVEAWLEVLLELPGAPHHWLAIETTGTGYRCTLWRRRAVEQPPLFPPGALEGTARFEAIGEFPGYVIPSSGMMTYREDSGPPALAAERFATDTAWLIGEGNGENISLETITA